MKKVPGVCKAAAGITCGGNAYAWDVGVGAEAMEQLRVPRGTEAKIIKFIGIYGGKSLLRTLPTKLSGRIFAVN